MTKVRYLVAGLACASALGLFLLGSPTTAAVVGEDIPEGVKKIADAIKKGDKEGAAKLVGKTVAKAEELGDIMHMFRLRDKGGLGFGATPLSAKANDGLEKRILQLVQQKDAPTVGKDAASYEESGYWLAALADMIAAKGPAADKGKKTAKSWQTYAKDMREASIEFAKAGAAKNGKQVQAAARKVNGTCSGCHEIFKQF